MRLELRSYQEDALKRIIEAEHTGARRQLGVAATGLGKAQPVDEPVLTPAGWRPIGDLVIGDLVIGSAGRPVTITGVFPQGVRPIVEVEFSDGATTRCDPSHLWTVRDKYDVNRGRPWRTMTAREVARDPRRWRVPLVAPVEFEAWPLPLDPYLLGVLLGDGGLSVPGRVLLHTEHELAASLVLPAPCTLSKLRDDGPGGIAGSYIIGGPTGRGSNPVLTAIRLLGLEGSHADDKRVPWQYSHASAADRLALLRGIMDADGHVRPKDGHVEITLANEGLIDDVAALVRSLGGTARKSKKPTGWTHLGVQRSGIAWRLSIALTVCPFMWKASRWRPRTKYPPTRRFRTFTEVADAEAVCISVDAPDQLYVTRDYVVTHNTVIFTALAEQRQARTLILVHRDELVSQSVGKLVEMWPRLGVTANAMAALRSSDHPAAADDVEHNPNGIGIVKAGADDVRAHVVVASVQTLDRPARMARLLDAITDRGSLLQAGVEPFNLIVVDEAHHAAAVSYRNILKALDAGEVGGPLLLGVTATPDRGDGVGLDDLFQTVVFNYDILWGIQAGYLSDVRGRAVSVKGLNVDKIKTTGGDYQAGDAGRAMEESGAPAVIAKAIKRHAKDRRTLVFTPTIATAEEVAAECVGLGLTAAWISGKTPMDDQPGPDGRTTPGRRTLLSQFKRGDIQVMANCAVLTEGFDDPGIGCVVVGRPTKSRGLYVQMVGRGTRRHPDKDHLLVLDVVGAAEAHSLITIPSLFGLGGKLRTKARRAQAGIAELVDEHRREQANTGRLVVRDVELFQQVRAGGIAWIPCVSKGAPRKRYVRPMPQNGPTEIPTVVLSQMEAGEDVWTAGLEWRSGAQRSLIRRVPQETAQGVAEDAVRKLTPSSALVTTDADWRARPPSSKLVRQARAWHVTITDGMTAGDVSDEINTRAAKAAHRKQLKARADALATKGA